MFSTDTSLILLNRPKLLWVSISILECERSKVTHCRGIFNSRIPPGGPDDNIQIPNYTVYRNDRPRTTNINPRGGTVILLKSSLSHYHTPTPPMGTVEATSCMLAIATNLADCKQLWSKTKRFRIAVC
ncbi:hypothetical protein TNCV_1454431 [Trichonephila clavipes]|nr:hypothetical protein TNCV_1454431 [Trichonephila clavipes]